MPAQRVCPYPGPRPLIEGQLDLLYGRSNSIDRMVAALKPNSPTRAFIVHASSGVGKTSVLSAGVMPELEKRDSVVVTFRDWSSLSTGAPQLAVISAFYWAFRRGAETDPDLGRHADRLSELMHSGDPDEDLFLATEYLNEQYGRRLVLVLDQVEEVLRLDRQRGLRFLEWVAACLQPRAETLFKVVFSLRSEFVAELGPIERALYIEYWDKLQLLPLIHRETLAKIVTVPSKADHEFAWCFEGEAAARLVDAWMLAAFDDTEPPGSGGEIPKGEFGLLHMQAALWVLWQRVERQGHDVGEELRGRVPFAVVERLVAASAKAMADEPPSARLCRAWEESEMHRTEGDYWRWVFDGVLQEYLEMSINDRVSQVRAGAIGAETKAQVARLAPRLSSRSYKIIADSDDLAKESGHDALPRDARVDAFFSAVVRTAREQESSTSFLGDGRDEESDARLLSQAFWDLGELAAEDLPVGLRQVDRASAAGRLRERCATLEELIFEMACTHERAVQWLVRAAVVRETPGEPDSNGRSTRFLSVVHDGYGPALRRWGLRTLAEVESISNPLVAVRGESPLYFPGDTGALAGTREDPIRFRNLVWQGCDISRDLTNVVFEECDLRGTVFIDCRLEDVTFLNCVTFGMLFISCTFVGDLKLSAKKEAPRRADLSEEVREQIVAERQIRGLGFERNCVFGEQALDGYVEGKLSLETLWGSGLSVTETVCPKWRIDYCRLEDVLIQLDEADGRTRGVIRDSVLHNLTLGSSILQVRGPDVANARQEVEFLAKPEKRADWGNEVRQLTYDPEVVSFKPDILAAGWEPDRVADVRHIWARPLAEPQ